MPVSQSDIDALNAALASGEKIVRIGDKLVEYHTPSDIIKARNDLLQQLAKQNALNGVVPRPRVIYHTQKGRGY